jgi:hypothetical protein
MKTVFQITFPQEPGMNFPIEDGRGHPMPIRARADFRPGGIPRRPLTRQEWDDQRGPGGHYLRPRSARKPVPDVDFEAEDGTLHKTAEACLAHELKARFGVETLAEVEAQMKAIADKAKLTVGDCQDALDSAQPSQDEAVRLLASALSRRGLKPAEAAKATGLTSQQCRAVVAANPDTFRENAGKLFLVS